MNFGGACFSCLGREAIREAKAATSGERGGEEGGGGGGGEAPPGEEGIRAARGEGEKHAGFYYSKYNPNYIVFSFFYTERSITKIDWKIYLSSFNLHQ
jgi:hypothetical protein